MKSDQPPEIENFQRMMGERPEIRDQTAIGRKIILKWRNDGRQRAPYALRQDFTAFPFS